MHLAWRPAYFAFYISSPCVPNWYRQHATTSGSGRRI